MSVSFTEDERVFKAITKDHKILKEFEAVVGVLGSDASSMHKDDDGSSISNYELATVHEFGSDDGKIPERSFLRQAMDTNQNAITKKIIEVYLSVLEGKDPKKELGKLGEFARGLVLEQFKQEGDPKWPPLAPSTVLGRLKKVSAAQASAFIGRGGDLGSSVRTLQDTGQLRQSIHSDVRKK